MWWSVGFFSWSSLGTASQQSSWMYWMTRLSHQLIFSSLMARAYSRTTMPRFIGLQLWKSVAWGHMSVREHEESFSHMNWPPQCPDFNPIQSIWVKGKDWRNGLTLLSSIQNLGQKWMQLWMEINVVTLHKIVETMPQQKRSVIKAKGGLFWAGSL